MKLPIAVGNKLFFRVVFPGVVTTAVLARFTQTLLLGFDVKIPIEYAFPVEVFIFGWAFVVLDMPIYMLFEGRKFWPSWLFGYGIWQERNRLAALLRTVRRYDPTRRTNKNSRSSKRNISLRLYIEAAVELSGFELNRETALQKVSFPTRLGNLIAAYEDYPRLKYGLDSVFFWPRLWVAIDKDLREELDNQQAQADGLLYLVAALGIAFVTLVLYAVVDFKAPRALMYAQNPRMEIGAAALCLFCAAAIYRFSLFSHAQFGELFKAVFDQHRALLNLDEVASTVATITNDPGLKSRSILHRNVAVWRLLRWHKVRFPGETKNKNARLE